MVTIYNKSNRPIGIAGQSVLPTQEIKVKDKDVYCAVFDENGVDTGKKGFLPGLTAMQLAGFITIKVEEEAKPVETVVETVVEAPVEATTEVAEEKPKRKYTKRSTEKTEE